MNIGGGFVMAKKQKDTYYIVYNWMTTKLKLKGNSLHIFALIYSYSNSKNVKTAETGYYGSQTFLANWFGISRDTVNSILKDLVSKHYLIKIPISGADLDTATRYIYKVNNSKLISLGISIQKI